VTITHRAPIARRRGLISCGEATQPSRPASRASAARCRTCDSTLVGTLTSRWSARRSRLVSTVTPRRSGRGSAKAPGAFEAASAAARAIARPPLAWMLSMKTPRRVASRTARPTVFGMSWNLRSRKTRNPRLRAVSIAAGPAAVKSCEPILQPVSVPSSRPSSEAASSRLGTSSAIRTRSAGLAEVSVILLQAQHPELALQQGLDRADGGLDTVDRGVVRDVLRHRRAANDRRIFPGPAVFGGVEEQGDVTSLDQVDHVGPVPLADLVDELDGHAVTLEDARGPGGRDEREAHLAEPLGERGDWPLVAVLHGDEDRAGRGQCLAGGHLRLEVGLAEVAGDPHALAAPPHRGPERGGRERAGGVARVHPGLLDVLHDPTDDHPLAVGDRIDVDLDRVLEELVDEYRVLRRHAHRLGHVLAKVLIVVDDAHRASTEHVRGANEDRERDGGGDRLSL